MSTAADDFVKEHVLPGLAPLGFARRERALVRLDSTATVAIVVTPQGSRWNLPSDLNARLGMSNHIDFLIQLFAGVDVPKTPKKILMAAPQTVGQVPVAACVYGRTGLHYRTSDDNLNAAVLAMAVPGPDDAAKDLVSEITPLLPLASIDDVLRWAAAFEATSVSRINHFHLATLLATLGRKDEARVTFQHPSCGVPALVAQIAARYGVDLSS